MNTALLLGRCPRLGWNGPSALSNSRFDLRSRELQTKTMPAPIVRYGRHYRSQTVVWAVSAHPRSLLKETLSGSAVFPQENL